MKCNLCKGEYRDRKTVLSFQRQGKSIVIEDVPALICDLCGDTLLSESTIRDIEELLESEPQGTAPLYRFRRKAPTN